jgi:FG-GAP-like repeat
VDIDGDGHLDILSGSYSRMESKMAGLFQVLYGNGDGTFRKAEVLKGTDGEPLIIPLKNDDQITENICTRPFAVDWDGDGKLDLVVGNFSGTFYWFKGEGKGKFNPKPEMIMAGKEPLRIPGAHSDPFVIDWDGDGDLDIVSGSSDGGIYWAENVAGKGKMPELKQFRPLIKPGIHREPEASLREKDLTGPSHAARIWIDDFNGDGKLDILVGDSVTLVSPAKGLTEEEMKAKLKEWEIEFEAAMKAMQSAGDDEKAREKANREYQKVYEKRSEFMKEEMTGYVWLYLQK